MKTKTKFYNFQNEILEKFESELDRGDKKIHIVAPPWSWKTIMWIEMINRLNTKFNWNTIIFVPNITLQYQWKEKIETMFLEQNENIDFFVSTNKEEIKNINILTYQWITWITNELDEIIEEILKKWFNETKEEFVNYGEFINYTEVLKETNSEEYSKNISKFKKKIKTWNTSTLISDKIKSYFEELKKNNIKCIVVDEAHHLTSWWSKVLYFLWEELEKPFIIGLTATPPFDNADFFTLDENYLNLLWEVDYYVPTPAVVKSWRLAPYNDLVYFVNPDQDLENNMKKNDEILNKYILENKEHITNFIFEILKEDYDKLLKNSSSILWNYLRFIHAYSSLDISEFAFDETVFKEVTLEDISKSIWKYLSVNYIKNIEKEYFTEVEEVKSIFYNLWYIWRANNFYKFRTPLEMSLIYSKSKINWVNKIIEIEKNNQKNDLKLAIITDFLEEWENNYLNCKYLLIEVNKQFRELKPILVSWQWIWKINEKEEFEELNIDILEATKIIENWESKIIIWTRWILWEWWDCPKLNTLIDLTWVSAYMSVNQIRWRAIRLDLDNSKKVANIYDIICLWSWYKANIDFERVKRKYENFYWVDSSWLILKWINHIYPEIENHLIDFEKINSNMLKRSWLKTYFYDLWSIWWEYSNKEIFWLNIEISTIKKVLPYVKLWFFEYFKVRSLLKNKEVDLEDLNKNNFYYEIIKRFIKNLIDALTKTLIKFWDLPADFKYRLEESESWNLKVVWIHSDELISKAFINNLKEVFSTVSSQKYVIEINSRTIENNKFIEDKIIFWLPTIFSKNIKYRNSISKRLYNLKLSNFTRKFLLFTMLHILWFYFFRDSFLVLFVTALGIFIYSAFIIYYLILKFSRKDLNFKYLNSEKVNKKEFVWKKPFITWEIEKIWM